MKTNGNKGRCTTTESKGTRKPVLMLRLNPTERERLDALVWDTGWTGDLATFVRELVLSKRRTKAKGGSGMVAVKLDEVLGILSVLLKDIHYDVPEQKRKGLAETKAVLVELAKELYSGQ